MLERLNEAMEYIEQHLDQPVEAVELARIAVTSEYHFRRMFSALAGMPLSEYIRHGGSPSPGPRCLTGSGRCPRSLCVTATARGRPSHVPSAPWS